MKTVNETASTSNLDTWSGDFQVVNKSGMTITNVSVEHKSTGCATVTQSEESMADNATSSPATFQTASGTKDYWIVSYLDSRGNLCTGYTTLAYHSDDEGAVVIFYGQTFSVTIGDRASEVKYLQKAV